MKALDPHRITIVTEPVVVESEGPAVRGLEVIVVLDEGAFELVGDGIVDIIRVGAIVVEAEFGVVGFTIGVTELGEVVIDGLNDEYVEVGAFVVLNAVN